jgi:hypothetical protein
MTTIAPIASRRTLARVPLISDELAKLHNIYCATDTRFRRNARWLQALYLRDQGIAAAHTADPEILTVNDLASTLHPAAAAAGQNFISEDVHNLVLQSLVGREEGAYYDVERLGSNALTSQALIFNALGPLALNLERANRVFQILFPETVARVEHIGFEHNPGRHQAFMLSDATATDAVVRFITHDGEEASIFIEGKYSESFLKGQVARWRSRYSEAIEQTRLFKNPDSPLIRLPGLEQLMREHMLSQLCVDHGFTTKGIFLVIAPGLNRHVQTACRLYANELLAPEGNRVPFVNCTLESFVEAINQAGDTDLASMLWGRYLDFERIYRLALEAVGAVPAPSMGRCREPASSTSLGTEDHAEAEPSSLPPVRPRRSQVPRTSRHEASPSPTSSIGSPTNSADAPSSSARS